ncbi:MAG: hypothetical protein HY825_15490 [Acidobacteria bacterium]|nr:hypothetical protein [Acidobacteriota bacterium]
MLDPEDTLALPLARSGEAQRSRILETATKFVVEWTHLYAINGEAFVVVDEETGRVMTILGYEVDDVAKACDDARRSGSCCPKSSMR